VKNGFDCNPNNITQIEFMNGGFFGGYRTILLTKADDGATIEVTGSGAYEIMNPHNIGKINITSMEWEKIVRRLFEFGITRWKKKYVNANVDDGEQWHLYVHYADKEMLKILGDNAYPKNFVELRELYRDIQKMVCEVIITPEFCEKHFKEHIYSIRFIPDKFITKEMCEKAFAHDEKTVRYMPERFITLEMCKKAVRKNETLLERIPKKYITPETCKIAIGNSGFALRYVPENLRTAELCELAIKTKNLWTCGGALQYVPRHLKTKELCELAVSLDGYALQYVPEHLITYELCKTAVADRRGNLKYVPENLKTEELIKIAGENAVKKPELRSKANKWLTEFLEKIKNCGRQNNE
jgi:hypothetical protein